jgi:FKBP-type peptidyl-prolyl cis-trans isomerase FkpA
VLVFSLLIFIFSCSSDNFKSDSSGMKYRFIEEQVQNKQPFTGDIVLIYMSYKTESDSVLFDTRELHGQPFRMKLHKPPTSGGTIDNAMAMMHEGDSACFMVDAEKFYLLTKGTEVPSFIKKGSTLTFNIRLRQILNSENFNESIRKETVANEASEQQELDLYLKNGNIQQKPFVSGLYYIETKVGQGETPKQGQKVTCHYIGSFLSGEVFDSSYQRGEPFSFIVGKKEIIPGMEEGVSKMKKGGKATLLIPSKLAYGDKQYKMIPPFSTLAFEIEIIDIN